MTDSKMNDLVKRWCGRAAAGTETAAMNPMVEAHGDHDEDTAYVLASDYDALRAELLDHMWWERTAVQLQQQRNEWAARYELAQKFLADILFFLPPPPMKLDDGRAMQFCDPDPATTLCLLQGAIARARDNQADPAPSDVGTVAPVASGSLPNRLASIQRRLKARGVLDIKFVWNIRPDAPLSHVQEDVCHVLEAYLDGRIHPLPPLGDNGAVANPGVNPWNEAQAKRTENG